MFLLSIGSFLIVGFTATLSFAAFAVILLVKRGKDRDKHLGIARMVVLYVFFYLVAFMLSITAGGYSIDGLASDIRLNLVPFIEIASNTTQYMQNMLLFVPLGLILPLLWDTFEKPSSTVVAGALFSFSIELMQLFSDRTTDIDDLIMNTLGALLGWAVFALLRRIAPKTVSIAHEPGNSHQRQEIVLCFALSWMAILSIYPLLLDSIVLRVPPDASLPML